MLIKNGIYYIFYRVDEGATFLITVSTDTLDIPQAVKLFYSVHSNLIPDRIYELSRHCLKAFTGMNDKQSMDVFTLLQANESDSYFKKHDGKAQTENHIMKMTSLPLLTVFDFQVRYPSIQGEE